MVSPFRAFVRRARGRAHDIYRNAKAPRLYNLSGHERVGAAFLVPSDMVVVDRIMLYALVRGLKPTRVLEIGVRYGGGARIIASALADNNHGQAVGIDPSPESFRVPTRQLHGRYQRLTGPSPDITPKAVDRLGGTIDLLLIDALHTGDAVYADFKGAEPFLSDGAHVLFHDAYHQGIASAIDEILEDPTFHDLGFLTRQPQVGQPVCYQGLRVLRKGQQTDSKFHIKEAFTKNGQVAPPFHPALRNYDYFANSIGKGANVAEVDALLAEAVETNRL